MSTSRRGFLGQLGLGAAAAAGSVFFTKPWTEAGKVVASDAVKAKEIKKCQTLLNDVARTVVPKPVDLEVTGQEILRIAQPTSWWVREGNVKAGALFTHKIGEQAARTIVDRLSCCGYSCTGMRAVRFKDTTPGRGPAETYTDPQCDEFKAIVRDAMAKDFHCMYGPVFRFYKPNGDVELFCGSSSSRRFALELGHEPYVGTLDVLSVKVTLPQFSYYTFGLEKFDARVHYG